MAHYIAIIEDAGPDHAVGVWFPDLRRCTSSVGARRRLIFIFD
jgi:hypothetical protein